MNAKRPSASRVETTQIVLPAHTNRFGTVFGGTVMSWIDVCAAVSAMRHAGRLAVTASMDQLNFLSGARTGDVMTLLSQVNYTGTTSMEVGVRVDSEDPVTGQRKHTASAYLTFVAVDEDGDPKPVPPIDPETEDERRRYVNAKARKKARLADRQAALQRKAQQIAKPGAPGRSAGTLNQEGDSATPGGQGTDCSD